jgi:hypothetical protein
MYWLGYLHGWVRSGRRFQKLQIKKGGFADD